MAMSWPGSAMRRTGAVIMGCLLACVGCQTGRPATHNGGTPSTQESHPVAVAPQLRPGMAVNVQVLVTGHKEIDEANRRISESGFLSLPLVGEVPMSNMTTREAQDLLKSLYRRYFVDPQVLVECQADAGGGVSPWGYITVLGRVRNPGQVNIPPTRDLTVSRAIQLAGGLDTSAQGSAIRVTRARGSESEQYTVNLDRIGSEGQTKDDIQLLPGDVVYVPEMLF